MRWRFGSSYINRRSHLSHWLGADEERTEVYFNTLKEYRSQQQRQGPRVPAVLLAPLEGRLAR